MCGITGLLDTRSRSSEEILKKMTDTMRHRGPDGGNEVFFQKGDVQIGLGHRRLSVIDLSELGNQPMQLGSLWISFNGEIYNYQAIRKVLSESGCVFKSNTDTEVILQAYNKWGRECLQHFRGMFAFMIINIETLDVFCARDRAGIKPFYFYLKDGLFLFSSELKAFHQHPKFTKQIDLNSVELFMRYGNIPAPYSIFDNTYKLSPGHLLEFNAKEIDHEHNTLIQHQYWNVYDAYNQPKLDISFDEAKIETERVLRESSELRMIADVPVGVFLSSGFDSSAVVSILQSKSTQKLKTFTVSIPAIGMNEAPFAKEIASRLGTDHTEVECSIKEAIGLIDDLPYFYDEPFGDQSAIPTSLVSRVAREKVTVALSADGGDEVFAGYNRYDYLLRYGKLLQKIPAPVRNSLVSIMNQINADKIPILRNKYLFASRYEKIKNLLKEPSWDQIMNSLSSQFDDVGINRLFLNRNDKGRAVFKNSELNKENYSELSFLMAIDYQTYLPDDILTKVDRATMRYSLEGREPFLDHKVIEWAARLPDSYKYDSGIKKKILREIVYKYLPKELMNRPKVGFAIPIEEWLLGELRSKVEQYLSQETIEKQGIFNFAEVERLRGSFMRGKTELGQKIWYLLMFQMWYEKWMA